MLKLAVLLGNPGLKYRRNRYNAPWMLAEALPWPLDWHKKFKGLYAAAGAEAIANAAAGAVGGAEALTNAAAGNAVALRDTVHLLKPQTYMNLSGESAQAAASFYKIKLDEIIVVHDDIELPFGFLSLKFSGGLGGHNGLRSMKAVFGGADFWRLRIGVGRPDGRIPGKGGSVGSSAEAGIADWVLSDFSAQEAEALAPVFDAGARLLIQAFAGGPESLLPEWAKKQCLSEKKMILRTSLRLLQGL